MNNTLLQVCYLMVFCPRFELSIIGAVMIVVNFNLRLAFVITAYNKDILYWYNFLVESIVMLLVLLIISLKIFKFDFLYANYNSNKEEFNLFEEEGVGVLNCNSFENQT